MDRLIHSNQLPGGNSSREFEGKEYGAGLTLILVDVETGHGSNLHRHPYEEMFVVQAGSGRFVVNDAVVQASAGALAVASAGSAYQLINSGSDGRVLTVVDHIAYVVT